MKKESFWMAIGLSAFALINLVLYVILSQCGVVEHRWISYLFVLGFAICVWIPFFCIWLFKLKVTRVALITYQVFMVLSIIVGSLWRMYIIWTSYDIVIHFSSGVVISLIAYSLFTSSEKNHVNMFWLFVILVSIAMLCGGVWEIWEFATDGLLGNNGQEYIGFAGRDALKDTMFDLICDFTGGLLGSSVALILYNKKRKSTFVERAEQEKQD